MFKYPERKDQVVVLNLEGQPLLFFFGFLVALVVGVEPAKSKSLLEGDLRTAQFFEGTQFGFTGTPKGRQHLIMFVEFLDPICWNPFNGTQ